MPPASTSPVPSNIPSRRWDDRPTTYGAQGGLRLAHEAGGANQTFEPPVAAGTVPDASPPVPLEALPEQARLQQDRLAHEHAWGRATLSSRVAWARRYRGLVVAHKDALVRLMGEELGLSAHEALTSEIAPLLASCVWLEKHAGRILRERRLIGAPWWVSTTVSERRTPLGKVAILASWHLPVQGLGVQVMQALVAGNRVVVKPSERCPRTQGRLLELAQDAGLPPGTLEVVGSAREAGATMLATQAFDHVIFTGSSETGQRVATALSKSMTPSTLHLTGRDSAFVLADADAKRAAQSLWAVMNLHSGQTCLAPRRVLVVGEVYDAFVQELGERARGCTPRSLGEASTAQRCKELVARALAKGALDLGRGSDASEEPASNVPEAGVPKDQRSTPKGMPPAPSREFRPTVLAHCDETMDVVEGRHEGPLLAVVRCANIEEALRIHGACNQHLGASIFTRDESVGEKLALRLGLTSVAINDVAPSLSHPALATGGRGLSGTGVSRGEEGLLAMTRVTQVAVGSHALARSQRPLPAWRIRLLGRMLAWWYGRGTGGRSASVREATEATKAAGASPATAV